MTMQDILTLAKAGYTAEQISALAAEEQTQPQEREQPQEQEQKPKQKPKQKQPKQKPEQEQPQEQEQEQKPKQKPKQKQQPEQPDIIAELREIKTALLKGAFIGAQQPAAQDAEAALVAIINPPDVLELLGEK